MKKGNIGFVALAMSAVLALSGCAGSGSASEATGEAASDSTQTQARTENTETESASAVSKNGSALSGKITDGKYGPLISERNLEDYVTLGEYKGLTVSAGSAEPTEEELQAAIDSDLESAAVDKEVTGRSVSQGDVVNIDFEGKKDGVAFDGGTAQGYDLEIGSGSFIAGFEDGLIGAEIGEERDLDLTFPENYPSEELAGADVVFTVKVNSIKEKEIPELTDVIVHAFNEKATTVEEYKELKKEELRAQKEESVMSNLKIELMDKVVENAQIKEVPQELIDEIMDTEVVRAQTYAESMGTTVDDFMQQYYGADLETFKQQYSEIAKTVAEQIITFFAIAQKEGMIKTMDDYRETMEERMTQYGAEDFEEFKETLFGRNCYEIIQTEEVVQFIYDNANIIRE